MIRITIIVLLSVVIATSVRGDDNMAVEGTVQRISSDSFTISGFESSFELTSSGLSGEFGIARIVLTESNQSFDNTRVSCPAITLTTRTVSCKQARFSATVPGIGAQTVNGAFAYDRYSETANIQLTSVAIAGGKLRFDITAGEAGISAKFAGTRLQLAALLDIAGTFTEALAGYSASGLADASGSFSLPADGPFHTKFSATLSNAALANDAGTIAADGVAADLDLDMSVADDDTTFTITFDSNQGEAYIEPVYANFSDNRIHLQADNVVTSDFAAFAIPQFHLQQASLLDVDGSASLSFPEDDETPMGITADVTMRDSAVDNLYMNLIKVELAGTVLGSLETDGRLSGAVSIADNNLLAATLQLNDVILDDSRGRFAIYGLNGEINWRASESELPGTSKISWDSGTAYNIIIGGGEMTMQLGGNDIELLAPLRLPTMGGALLINQLALKNFGLDDATGTLDAELEPVQLGQLTGAFGWPAFSGTLSGRLPLLHLEENTITVGGTLSARAFDGTMEMSKLSIEQPFGRVPRLRGDLAFRGLDLQRVTEAFSFGLIQGRLSGDVAGLRMQSWRPVAMDMHFYTPQGDKSEHRISQRAVENLASVGGGGAAAALSSGFLRFFEVFAYDRIGLRCVLKDGVCAMSGAGSAKGQEQTKAYYIVKGRGVPRIDVVGFRDTVSWPRLVKQLAAITKSGTPTVN